MKKLLLLWMLISVSGVMVKADGQVPGQKTGPQTFHEAHFKVFDAYSMRPVAHASIYNKSGKALGNTDDKGIVVLSLPASNEDVYTIKAGGFSTVNMQLEYASMPKADYEVLLPPSGSVPGSGEDGAKIYVKQDPATYKKAKPEEDVQLEFAVQLAASSKPITDMSSLKSWEELGPVYIKSENGMYKVRLGPFDSQDKAKQVLLQAKERGKKDAFIVIQKGLENYTTEGYEKLPVDAPEVQARIQEKKSAPATTKTPTQLAPALTPNPQPKAQVVVPVEEGNVEYKVRLASYLKPGGFNTKDIDQYGTLESYRKGEWTIMMIGGFKSEQDAIRVKDEVVKKGYKDAAVVVVRDGILQETEK